MSVLVALVTIGGGGHALQLAQNRSEGAQFECYVCFIAII